MKINTLPCNKAGVESRVEDFIPLFRLHSFLNVKRSGVPGRNFPFARVIWRPSVNFAIPDVRFEHGSMTLNSEKRERGWSSQSLLLQFIFTLGFWRDSSFWPYRNDWCEQHLFIERHHVIKVVAIFSLSSRPRKVHVTDFRRYYRHERVKSRVSEQRIHTPIVDGKYSHRVAAKHLHLLLAYPQ
jgi:hypothetical protein